MPYPSPFMTSMLITGTVFIAVAPPLGVIIIVLAYFEQRRLNSRHRSGRQAALEAARQREYDQGVRYFR